ncbi:hypothetical protein AX14_007485 [Amanita brunnescens Koide BX004]|nr:hypothetical protein AX14_007485 [Amanita brunnescens Koide BX004]
MQRTNPPDQRIENLHLASPLHSSCSWRTQPLITQSSDMSTVRRTTSSRSKNCHWMKTFILRPPHPTPFYQRTSQNQLGIFRLYINSCRSPVLEARFQSPRN